MRVAVTVSDHDTSIQRPALMQPGRRVRYPREARNWYFQ